MTKDFPLLTPAEKKRVKRDTHRLKASYGWDAKHNIPVVMRTRQANGRVKTEVVKAWCGLGGVLTV